MHMPCGRWRVSRGFDGGRVSRYLSVMDGVVWIRLIGILPILLFVVAIVVVLQVRKRRERKHGK
jgi:hypothetical protein